MSGNRHKMTRSENRSDEKIGPGQDTYGLCQQNRMAAVAAAIEGSYHDSDLKNRWPTNACRLKIDRLVAIDHVLGHSLQANDRVSDQRQTPEPAVVLTQPVGSRDRRNALYRSHSVSPANRRMCAV